ncbi:hypothetical protein ACJZ2D_007799 [Fusarium nematophilum]
MAVHAITSAGLPPSPSSIQSPDSVTPYVRRSDGLMQKPDASASQKYDDVSVGVISEFKARKLFQLHAYQMGQEMGLPDMLHLAYPSLETLGVGSDRHLFRRMRTALTLHHVEQEVASGTARRPKGLPVDDAFLRAFHSHLLSAPSDLRIVTNVGVTQLRGHDLGVGCFQRSSIRLQRDYAFIIVCSAMISKLRNELSAAATAKMMTDEMKEIIDLTLERSICILQFIADSNDYKWHLFDFNYFAASIQGYGNDTDDQDNDDFATITTTRGQLRAKHIIHATNSWVGHLVPELRPFVSPVRANVQRRVPQPAEMRVTNSWWLRYGEKDYDYMIQRPDGAYIIGRANTGRRATADDGTKDFLPHLHLQAVTPLIYNFGSV